MKKNRAYLLALALFWAVPPIVFTAPAVRAQNDIRVRRGQVKLGISNATLRDAVPGNQPINPIGISSQEQTAAARLPVERSIAYLNIPTSDQAAASSFRTKRIVLNAGSPSSGKTAVLGRNYNATGNISCSVGEGQPAESCFFGVIRQGNGSGIVTVKKPDGRSRAIIFKNGKAEGYEQSEVDTDRFSSSKQGDLNIIRIGPERYEIPDAVVLGG